MRRNVAEYSEFVAMRWPSLVRTAYLLTGDHGHAEDLAQSALTKCLLAWPRLRVREAADAYVRKALLNTYISWRRKSSWHEMPSEDPPAAQSYDATEGLAQRSVVLDALATLPPKQRAVVVLRFYEDLGVRDVAQQLGCSTGSVKRQTWGPYRAGNTVYLDNGVQVTAKRLANRMAEVPGGVVYTTETGDVVLLTRDGQRRQIGDHAGTHQGGSMDTFPEPASDPETGWVAWMEENDGGGFGEIVVYDTTVGRLGEEVDRRRIGYEGNRDCGDPRTVSYGPFAVDGGAVYYCTGQGDYVWRPTSPDGAPRRILPVVGDPTTADDYLLDVRAGRQVVIRYGGPTAITEIMPVGATRPEVVIRRDLFDGFLSHDGRYLGSLTDLSKEVYDASTGERVTPDYRSGQGDRVPLAMTFTDDGAVAYALIHPQHGDSKIVTCALPDGKCETQLQDLNGGVFFANQRHQ